MAKIDENTRLKALRELTDNWMDDIEEIDTNQYEINGEQYLVVTDEEADKIAKTSVLELLDDMGLDAMSENAQEYVLSHFIDETFINNLAQEYADSIVDDTNYELDDEEKLDLLISYKVCKKNTEVEDVDFDKAIEELRDAIVDQFDLESYGEMIYGRDWVSEMKDILVDGLNMDDVADYVIESDGRALSLALYDGKENEVKVDGEYIYLYRID